VPAIVSVFFILALETLRDLWKDWCICSWAFYHLLSSQDTSKIFGFFCNARYQ